MNVVIFTLIIMAVIVYAVLCIIISEQKWQIKQLEEELRMRPIFAHHERKKGRWMPMHNHWARVWECSECGYRVDLEDNGIYHFCNYCGAEMEVDE